MRAALAIVCLLGCGTAAVAEEPAPSAPAPAPRPVAPGPVVPQVSAFHGTRVRLRLTDEESPIPRPIACLPPADLVGPADPRPVLYVLDGDYFLDELDLCGVVENLARAGAIEPWIVVGIPSTAAREDMLAAHPEELGARVLHEVEPALAEVAQLAHGADGRALLGYSYGGLAALRMAMAQPAAFGRVVAMSPSLWWGDGAALAAFEHVEPLPSRLYLDAGSAEGGRSVVPPMVGDVRALAAIARARGMRFGRELAVREVMGQAHDMRMAGTRLPGALVFALGSGSWSSARPVTIEIALYPAPAERSARTFAIEARYADDVVLSWPPDLAQARLGTRPLERAWLGRTASGELTAEVAGVAARVALAQ